MKKIFTLTLLTLVMAFMSISGLHSQESNKVLLFIRDGSPDLEFMLKEELGVMKETLEAADGEEAISIFRKEPIALSFVDINMPKMDGIAYLEEVKKTDSDAVVIMMTGFPSAETIIETIEDDGYTYITKPFHIEQIQDLVIRGLDFYQLSKKNK